MRAAVCQAHQLFACDRAKFVMRASCPIVTAFSLSRWILSLFLQLSFVSSPTLRAGLCVLAIARGDALPRLKNSKENRRQEWLAADVSFRISLRLWHPFRIFLFWQAPSHEQVLESEGVAHFQYRMKQGYMLLINGDDYTCGGLYLNADPSCFISPKVSNGANFEGKIVTVLWFQQPAHLFDSVRRVVDIRYEGASQLPAGYLEKRLQSERESAKNDALFASVLMLFGLLFCEWVDRVRRRNGSGPD